MLKTRSLWEVAAEVIGGVFRRRVVISGPPQTRSFWSVSQDMKNKNDCPPKLTCLFRNAARNSLFFLLLLLAVFGQTKAQSVNDLAARPSDLVSKNKRPEVPKPAQPLSALASEPATAAKPANETGSETPLAEGGPASPAAPQFRVERERMTGGAELLTIFGRLDGMRSPGLPAPEVPLLSVVRDTLSDEDPENDRLRYVWMLTYAKPTMMKRIASAIPFFYQPVGSRSQASQGPPTPILDLANTSRQTWNRFFWMGLQNIFLDSYGIPLKSATRSYRHNAADYRTAHVTQALSILGNYENLRQRFRNESELLAFSRGLDIKAPSTIDVEVTDAPAPLLPKLSPGFTTGEMRELRARLILSGKTFGGLFGPDKFSTIVEKYLTSSVDTIGHNWEMLRQRAEAEGLYFQPLTMPDGRPTHVLLWIARSDLITSQDRSFERRFLNIANPWNDKRLLKWNGHVQTIYLDEDNRPTAADNPRARATEMIPLALYGLDHPKIPALLIDFRDTFNPKGREMSRRAVKDLAGNIFPLSNFGSLPYFLGRNAFDFVTGRRGMDLNQPTRLTSYSELKLLLSFNNALDAQLRREIERRVEIVSVNPLSNDNRAEIQLARQQYDNLIAYARRPDGLPARIERDRRAEMAPLNHGPVARFFFNLGNVLSFGRYVHRENATPELAERLELARRIERHTQFLSLVAKSSPETEVAWEMETVKRSLQFLADHGVGANGSAARAAASIFQRTNDAKARRLCLDALYNINTKTARNQLLRLYREEQSQSEWRLMIAEHLRKAVTDDPHMKPAEARSVLGQVGQP